MKSILVLCGGRSGEHEVSLQSARSVVTNLDRARYTITVAAIRKDGRFVLYPSGEFLVDADDPSAIALAPGGIDVALLPDPTRRGLLELESGERHAVDVVIPVMHGTYAEDGTLQGLFEMASMPYVGAGVCASALAMDKILSKQIFERVGLPVVPYLALGQHQWAEKRLSAFDGSALEALGWPLFVKPSNLGSSVGIACADDRDELEAAIDDAFRYDTRVVVERGIDRAREIEGAVLGNERVECSVLGEIVPRHRFYSYEAKYIDPDGAELRIPASLDTATSERIRALACRAFLAVGCSGLARVDFLLDRHSGEVFLNEVNTMPGFTRISMYPKLWEASGLGYSPLLDRLIALAEERYRARAALTTDFHA
ncbi:MAG: D-alanine--D-alanine ligase [Myxococcales bacterium]|nr:D-alanine--D-alanine ligase [Myxococcales bacterium]